MPPIKIRTYAPDPSKFEVDFFFDDEKGKKVRKRLKSPCRTEAQTRTWAERKLAEWIKEPPKPKSKTLVPTLAEYAPVYLAYVPDSQGKYKPSGQKSKESILQNHWLPVIGTKRLDQITDEDWKTYRDQLLEQGKAQKTISNVLTVLNALLKTAVERRVIEALPCQIRLMRRQYDVREDGTVKYSEMRFFSFEEYERMLDAPTAQNDLGARAIILLGGRAGLRMGELLGLWWEDIDFKAHYIRVKRSMWKGQYVAPKSQRPRSIPMVSALEELLRDLAARKMHPKHVICRLVRARQKQTGRKGVSETAELYTEKTLRTAVLRILKEAGIEDLQRPVHSLRHTFASHLAMKGASVKAIAQFAGHANIQTTFRYMHLSPEAEFETIKLIEL